MGNEDSKFSRSDQSAYINSSTADLEQPDESRPAKRVRLDAPLGITEDVQEEVVDEDDWDDIYDTSTTPAIAPARDGGALFTADPDQTAVRKVESDGAVEDGVRAEAVDDGDELVAEEEHVASIDEPSVRMLEETSHIEGGQLHSDRSVEKTEAEDESDVKFYKDTPEEEVGSEEPLSRQDDGDVKFYEDEPAQEDDLEKGPEEPPSQQEDCDSNFHQDQPEQSGEQETNTVQSTSQQEDGDVGTEADGIARKEEMKPGQDPDFLAAATAQKDNQDAEWQFDDSDAASSDSDSESDSVDSSDDSESGSEGGYEMLDPATAAKILMSGDGDDDDGDKSKNKTGDHQPRTVNEIKEVAVPKPDVVLTEDMKITLLGTVDRTVDTLLLIKAFTPGEFQVLESGSVLCNEKREVIGAVAETLGRVQEPMYSVAFANLKDIEDMGLGFGSKVYYVDSHSTFVFTQPLKNMKGTDASNIHDEEVGEDEIEFSDDEAEAEYKRQKKLAKRGGRGGLSRTAFVEDRATRSFGAPGHDSGHAFVNGSDAPQQQYGGGISYDDDDVQDEFYSPLKRPDNLSQLMAGGGLPPRPQHGPFDRGRGRGRGDRGRGRGDRGRGRGGFDHRGQRGGRGGYGQDRGNRGGYGQQNGHRGAAHSFPDRHNNDRTNGQRQHSSPPKSNTSQSSPPPPAQQRQAGYQQYQQPTPNQQSYQFNGYTFQYGNPPPQPPPQQAGHYNQSQATQSPTGPIPAGAYVNPALFQAQPVPAQWNQQAMYNAWPNQQQQQAQQYPQGQSGPVLTRQQQNNLADILRQFGGQLPR